MTHPAYLHENKYLCELEDCLLLRDSDEGRWRISVFFREEWMANSLGGSDSQVTVMGLSGGFYHTIFVFQ